MYIVITQCGDKVKSVGTEGGGKELVLAKHLGAAARTLTVIQSPSANPLKSFLRG
jgi:hypothetical protein